MERQSVFIAIPCYSGEVSVPTVQSLLNAIHALDANSIDHEVQILTNCSLVQDARDMLAGFFLASKQNHTDILWIDSDVRFNWMDMINMLRRPVDFVAGSYRYKKDEESYPMGWTGWKDGDPLYAYDPLTGERSETGLFQVDYVPMGFCRMKRCVIERVAESRKEFKYTSHQFPDMTFTGMFDREVRNGASIGEDTMFCHRWREIGGSIYVEPWFNLGHYGKKLFSGSVGDWLRNRGKEPSPEEMREKFRAVREQMGSPEMQRLVNLAIGEAA